MANIFYIDLYVDGQKVINKASDYLFVAGTKNLYGVRVKFSSLWANVASKYIQLKDSVNTADILLDEFGQASIPAVFTENAGEIKVNIFGGDKITTTSASIKVTHSDYDGQAHLIPEAPPLEYDYMLTPSGTGNISRLKLIDGVIYNWNGTSWDEIAVSASIINQVKEAEAAAETAAQTATTKASEAADSAQTATDKAAEAKNSANSASGSKTAAQTYATAATTQATQAAASANLAASAKTAAETAKSSAETSATTATTKASEAAASATAAQTSATTATTKAAEASASAQALTNVYPKSEVYTKKESKYNFCNALRKTVTGTANGNVYNAISVTDAAEASLTSLKIYGYSYQTATPTPSSFKSIYDSSAILKLSVNSGSEISIIGKSKLGIGNIRDEYDLVSGTGVARLARIFLTGTSSDGTWSAHEVVNGVYVYKLAKSNIGAASSSSERSSLCSHYLSGNGNYTTAKAALNMCYPSTGAYFFCTDFPTLNDFLAFVNDLYVNDNGATKVPISVVYKLASETALTGTPQAISFNNGANTVSINKNCQMSVTYNRDINVAINEIATAITALQSGI